VSGYCTPEDLYSYGLQRGALANPGRLAPSASAATNAFMLDQHGFPLNEPLTLRAEGGGALPAPLVAGVTYYAIPLNESSFSVAATVGGAAIDLTTNGVRVVVGTQLPFAAAIAFGAALIDDMLPAHIVPLVAPYPPIVVMTNAELAIGKLTAGTGNGSKSIGEMVDVARKRLERWAAGVPLRGANVPPAANLAATAVATAPARDCRGWRRWGTL
jgi:hypothetical protein